MAALEAGAWLVIPAADGAHARRLVGRLAAGEEAERPLLCGEEGGLPPAGYDLGNSPAAFTPARVANRVVVYRTSNGTPLMHRVRASARLRVACFRNAEAVAAAVADDIAGGATPDGVAIACAGRRGRLSMDDAWSAGHLVERIARRLAAPLLTDGARAAAELASRLGVPTAERLGETAAGRALGHLGLAEDLAPCAALDHSRVVPLWRSHGFVKGG
ncbi:MAG: 2-phosphosulfolactate phosphatase [Gemmatimonadota bacterium]